MRSIREFLNETAETLAHAGIADARFEARTLLCRALGMDLSALLLRGGELMDEAQASALSALAHRRAAGEPLQYLIGEWGFMGLAFFVSPAALIPRQDTEALVEGALRFVREHGSKTALDLCCGTGCIGISAAALGGLTLALSDISADCIALAQKKRRAQRRKRAIFYRRSVRAGTGAL